MKLTEIFDSNKLSLSFEVFPPKTDTAAAQLLKYREKVRMKLAARSKQCTVHIGGNEFDHEELPFLKTETIIPCLKEKRNGSRDLRQLLFYVRMMMQPEYLFRL